MARFLRIGGAPVLLLVICLGFSGLTGCGSGGKPAEQGERLSVSDLQQAEALFVSAQTAADQGDLGRALDLTDQLVRRHPSGGRVDEALGQGAEWALSLNDTLRAAGYEVALYDRNPSGRTEPDGQPSAAPLLATLNSEQLKELSARNPGNSLIPYLGYLRVEKLMGEGQVAEAETVVRNLKATASDDSWTLAASALLFGGPEAGGPFEVGEINPNQVGVICPLTGRFALLGNAFYDGALLALEVTNEEMGTAFELKVEDSEGDPVAAALAARRLCREEGSLALFGALMSDPTATVALVANLWQTPLVSPTATNERIWELGEGIFQTNLTGLYETRLLASLAATVMLKERFGLLYPDTPEGRGYAEAFRAEVEGWGGRIVAQASFPSHTTDFKDPILALRRERPEVIFVPASVDQMVLLGPQLDFYRAGSLVMGLSNWNSEKLREKSGSLLERAVFPNDLALFPDQWTSEFRSRWNGDNYPREATTLALKSYQATRMLLDTMVRSEATSRLQLTHALRNRLASSDFESEGPESFAGAVRMFSGQQIVPFPVDRFAEAWQLTEGAAADSLATDEFIEDGENIRQ